MGVRRIGLWRLDLSPRRGQPGAAKTRSATRVALIALALAFGAALPASAAKIPPGMVAYDKPVFKNGRRVLYHGPSHGAGKSAAKNARAVKPKVARPAASRAAPSAKSNDAGPPEPPAAVKAGALGAAAAAPALAAAATLSPAKPLRLAMDARLGGELARAMTAKGVDLTLAEEPADLVATPMPLAPGAQLPPGLVAIARLYDCEIALVGSAGMTSLADLDGKRVAAPPETSAAGRAARRLFAAAGVAARFVETGPEGGGADMRAGRAEGFAVVSPTPRIDDAPPGARLLAIPYRGAVRDQFLPVELGKAVFPALKDAETVDSVAQPVLLAAVEPDRDPARRAALARFVDAFFTALASGALPDRKWGDVNPAAKLPFSRFEAARNWVQKAWIDTSRPN